MSDNISFADAQKLFWKNASARDISKMSVELQRVLDENPIPPAAPPPSPNTATAAEGNTSSDPSAETEQSDLQVPPFIEHYINQMQSIIHRNTSSFIRNNPSAAASAAEIIKNKKVSQEGDATQEHEQKKPEQPKRRFTTTKQDSPIILGHDMSFLGDNLDIYVIQETEQ